MSEPADPESPASESVSESASVSTSESVSESISAADPGDDEDPSLDAPEPVLEQAENPSVAAPAPAASAIPDAAGGLGLLYLEGASLALGLFFALRGDTIVSPYVWSNTLLPRPRMLLLVAMFGTGAVLSGAGGLALVLRRISACRLVEIGRRLSPLALAGLLPLLFQYRLWSGRDLQFLALLSLVTLAGLPAVRACLAAPPVFPRLRLGARLVPLAQRIPWTAVVLLGAAGYAAYFSFHTLHFHLNTNTRSFDLGLEENVLWNIVHGGHLFKGSPMFGPEGGYAGWHVPFIGYVLAGLYALHQHASTLLVVQSVLVGAAAVPLYGFSRRLVGAPSAALIALAYLLYPAVHGPNLYDFHYLTIAPVFLWASAWALEVRRDRLLWLVVPLTLSVREDVAAGLAVLGAFFVLSGRRPRAGLIVTGVATVYFVAMKFVLMPIMANHSAFVYIYQGLLPAGENTFGAVLKTVLGNPAFTLGTLLEREKLVYLLQFLAPLGFLPLRRPIVLLLLVPGFFFTLLSTGYPPTVSITFQYAMHWTMFLFLALPVVIEHMRQGAEGLVRQRAAIVVVCVGTLAGSSQFGAVLHHETARGGFGSYVFGRTDEDRKRGQALDELVALVPPRAKIVGSETVVPHVSNRPDAYTIRIGLYDAEYVLFSIAPTTPDERNFTSAALQNPQFGVIATRPGFALLKRGAPTTKNAEVLREMGIVWPPPPVVPPAAPAKPPVPLPAVPEKPVPLQATKVGAARLGLPPVPAPSRAKKPAPAPRAQRSR